jgi:chromosome segregation ATPase
VLPVALARRQLEMRESAAQGDAERQRLCSQLVLAQRARAHEQERQRSSAQEAKELRARLVGVRRQVGGALCAALYETLRARAAALRLALGRWADAARFLEPALGSSEGHLARLRAKLLEVQRGMVDGRDAAERTRAELGEQRAAADAARELARQGERAMRQSDAERRQLADELRASELRCADLEAQLHSARAIMFASDE